MSDKLQEYEKLTEQLNREDAARFLTRAKQRGTYICPFCNNGSGETGDGITKQKGSTRYTCFKCKAQGDKGSYTTIDLIGGLFGLEDFAEARNKAAELYGYALPGSDKAADPKYKEALKKKQEAAERKAKFEEIERKKQEEAERVDHTAYYKDRAEHITETDYMQSRGISLETCKHFLIGYEPEWRHPKAPQTVPTSERVIIPISRYNYLARATGEEVPKEYQKQRAGKSDLFNKKALNTAALAFITEGEIDAMSIYEAGHEAIATGSAANKQLVIDEIARRIDQSEHIPLLAIVPDKDETGDKAAKYIINEVEKLGVKIYTAAELTGAYKDSNDYLKADREAFIMAVNDKAREIMADNTAADQSEEVKPYVPQYSKLFQAEFMQFCEKEQERISTGILDLDIALKGGLTDELYILGAETGQGKSAFSMCLAENIARQGKDVLYFALEMSRKEIIARGISALSWRDRKKYTENPISAGDILYYDYDRTAGDFLKVPTKRYSKQAEQWFKEYGNNLIIIENTPKGITAADIAKITKQHIETTGNKPIVFVDYLQMLAPDSSDRAQADRKTKLDVAIRVLKGISIRHSIPVFTISSLNRIGYGKRVNSASLKESGDLEYTAGILLGLNLDAQMQDYNSEKEAEEKIKKALNPGKDKPREMTLEVMKFRNGTKRNDVKLHYYATYNYFTTEEEWEEVDEKAIEDIFS